MKHENNNRELTEEELELVVGGMSQEKFDEWRTIIINTTRMRRVNRIDAVYNCKAKED